MTQTNIPAAPAQNTIPSDIPSAFPAETPGKAKAASVKSIEARVAELERYVRTVSPSFLAKSN